ncbi:MAG: murein L,D-transpeptidase family protein [Verrucomicrobiota bacterium]
MAFAAQPSRRKSFFVLFACLSVLFLGPRFLPMFLPQEEPPLPIRDSPEPPEALSLNRPTDQVPPGLQIDPEFNPDQPPPPPEPVPNPLEDPDSIPPEEEKAETEDPPDREERKPVTTPHPAGLNESRAERVAEEVSDRLRRELREVDLVFGDPVFMRVFKNTSEFEVWVEDRSTGQFRLFRNYPIARFSGRLGPKQKEGDYQAPEGFYTVTRRSMNPRSNYHLSFNLGYPNRYDRSHGRTGSYLMVHGSNVSIGCFAMTDPLIEEIYTLADAALKRGQDAFQVHSFPFRMDRPPPRAVANSKWTPFWANLKEGFDRFEKDYRVPEVSVSDKRYVFR